MNCSASKVLCGFLLLSLALSATALAIYPNEYITQYAHDVWQTNQGLPQNSDLTTREAEVLNLIARGNSNKEIAQALAITECTVKGHVNNILRKLGVSDRTQAVTTATQRGIVHLD